MMNAKFLIVIALWGCISRAGQTGAAVGTASNAHNAAPSAGQTTTCHECSPNNDEEMQKLAIATLAHMATNLISIGNHSNDAQLVATNVVGIMESFVNFVAEAMKDPKTATFLQTDEFRELLRSMLVQELHRTGCPAVP